jgi:hypothetical protein
VLMVDCCIICIQNICVGSIRNRPAQHVPQQKHTAHDVVLFCLERHFDKTSSNSFPGKADFCKNVLKIVTP